MLLINGEHSPTVSSLTLSLLSSNPSGPDGKPNKGLVLSKSVAYIKSVPTSYSCVDPCMSPAEAL